jgi:hypothetical protein
MVNTTASVRQMYTKNPKWYGHDIARVLGLTTADVVQMAESLEEKLEARGALQGLVVPAKSRGPSHGTSQTKCTPEQFRAVQAVVNEVVAALTLLNLKYPDRPSHPHEKVEHIVWSQAKRVNATANQRAERLEKREARLAAKAANETALATSQEAIPARQSASEQASVAEQAPPAALTELDEELLTIAGFYNNDPAEHANSSEDASDDELQVTGVEQHTSLKRKVSEQPELESSDDEPLIHRIKRRQIQGQAEIETGQTLIEVGQALITQGEARVRRGRAHMELRESE